MTRKTEIELLAEDSDRHTPAYPLYGEYVEKKWWRGRAQQNAIRSALVKSDNEASSRRPQPSMPKFSWD